MAEARLPDGIYPACVTPFDAEGQIDEVSLARLAAYFESSGCAGMVVAGSNGEGPSLSAVEKRDLARAAVKASSIPVILGIATPSLTEAVWLASQAGKSGVAAVLVLPPAYYRSASRDAILEWLLAVADASPVPILGYNHPGYCGFTMDEQFVAELTGHPNVCGIKDSTRNRENFEVFRKVAPGKSLFVGGDILLPDALSAGWNGSISAAANLVPQWIAHIAAKQFDSPEQALAKFEILLPILHAIQGSAQPAVNKAVLAEWGLIETPGMRLPLTPADGRQLADAIREVLGIHRENLAIPKLKPGQMRNIASVGPSQ